MRVAVISDIHANLPALEATAEAIEDALDEPTVRMIELGWGEALRLWGYYLRAHGHTEQSLPHLEHAAEGGGPLAAAAHDAAGQALTELDRFDAALERFDRALEVDSARATTLIARARAGHLAGRDADALADLERALELGVTGPPTVHAHVGAGLALEAQGRGEDADAAFARALGAGGAPLSLLDRGYVLAHYRAADRAAADFRAAHEAAPGCAEAAAAVARHAAVHGDGGGLEDALALAERAVALEGEGPALAVYLDTAGLVLTGLGRHEEALTRLDRAAELWEHSLEIRTHRDEARRRVAGAVARGG
jgi:tetratricopeptide (TPR) repeat protein